MRARSQFEVQPADSRPDPDRGRLLIQAYLTKQGKKELDTLTLRVEQLDPKGTVLRVDHVPVDVSGYDPYDSDEISFAVPLAEGQLQGLSLIVEREPQAGVAYPELDDLPSEEG